jgi:D-xylose transport system substrate-binding protein
MAGSVPVSGQDGDHAALNRVALGTQTVSVWKDARLLGRTAGEQAMTLAKGTKLGALQGTKSWADGPRKVAMTSILLTPVPITKDNLDVVIQAGWVPKDVVCRGVKAGTAKACN